MHMCAGALSSGLPQPNLGRATDAIVLRGSIAKSTGSSWGTIDRVLRLRAERVPTVRRTFCRLSSKKSMILVTKIGKCSTR